MTAVFYSVRHLRSGRRVALGSVRGVLYYTQDIDHMWTPTSVEDLDRGILQLDISMDDHKVEKWTIEDV
jgi:hypothetical protein